MRAKNKWDIYFWIFFFISGIWGAGLFSQTPHWKLLDDGLSFVELDAPQKSDVGDSKISILKIDPETYEFKLLTAKENRGNSRTFRQWAQAFNLTAVINAGMYQTDLLTSVGYMKNYRHINNNHVNRNNSVFAFSPVDSTLVPARIIDRTCDDFDSLRQQYHCMFQSIRMISCDQKNVWAKQPNRWSIAILGVDNNGNVLFIFSRSPYRVHDIINILLALPISISRAMYLEGGAKAGLYIKHNDFSFEKYGGFENAFVNDNSTREGWPIPNVLGIVKRKK